MPQSEFKKTVCPLDCPDACSLVVEVQNEKAIGLQGDPDHPYTAGFLCAKVRQNLLEKVNGPARLRTPMIRNGPRGRADSFEPISTDEALEFAARKIIETKDRYGGEAILPYSYAGNMGLFSRAAGFPFFHKLGASKLHRSICTAALAAGYSRHAGSFPGTDPETAEHSDLIIIWGMNVKVTSSHFVPFMSRARKRGARVVVVDVYRTATARAADLFIQINPAKDAHLALALSKRLIDEDRLDHEFIGKYTTGYEGFQEYVHGLDETELLRASGVEASVFQKFLEWIGRSDKVFLRTGVGFTRNSRGENSTRAVVSLGALLGLFTHSVPGHGILLTTGGFSGDSEILEGSGLLQTDVRTINMLELGTALKQDADNPVHLLFVYNSNPLAVAPHRDLVLQGLQREDLFTIVREQTMTETALQADLLIPATTSLENHDVYRAYGQHYMTVTDPVVSAPVGVLSNVELFSRLASRLGFTEEHFTKPLTERRREYLQTVQGVGDSSPWISGEPKKSVLPDLYEKRKEHGQWKFTFAADRRGSEPHGFPAAAPAREFDAFRLNHQDGWAFKALTPPHKDVLNSTFAEFHDRTGVILIHPADAKRLAIENGQPVTVESKRGAHRRPVQIEDGVPEGVIILEGIFRGDSENGGVNSITSDALTETAGGGTFHENLVKVLVD